MAPLGRAPLLRGGHRSCGERGLRPEGAERALAAHRGHCQHVSPASRDRGQCVCVGEHWQHSLRTRMCGGGSWQRAGCERSGYAGLGTVRSLPGQTGRGRDAAGVRVTEEDRTPLTRCSPCRDPRSLRLPKPAPGQDVAALIQSDEACPVSLAPGQARAPREYTVSSHRVPTPCPHTVSPRLCEAPAHPRLL